ncbi:DUF998 domain-containing protein [Asticcacaulis sp. 201]|uniref:DUF998 domain-containing protein n=1 Tax=Asticcacaulis sp. 201 TaxID=3028787 RepID=UPI0029166C6E|nr:DUF998 domain-containing protein [Asticcacaulis sp. 201]MDV6329936.1 DUF998 domain-containing protein [Asticcacaulis sp. 201]
MSNQTLIPDAPDRNAAIAATVSLFLFSYFSIALIALHFIRPDYTPIDHMISDYAVGRAGWLMTTAFVALGFGCLSLSLGLWRAGPKKVSATIGRLLLILAFLGLMVTAVFPTDLETAKDTLHGTIHTASFLVNIVSISVAALTLSLSFGADPRWKSIRLPSLLIVVALVGAFVVQYLTLHRGAPYGFTNRAFVLVVMSWLFFVAFCLKKIADGKRPQT